MAPRLGLEIGLSQHFSRGLVQGESFCHGNLAFCYPLLHEYRLVKPSMSTGRVLEVLVFLNFRVLTEIIFRLCRKEEKILGFFGLNLAVFRSLVWEDAGLRTI